MNIKIRRIKKEDIGKLQKFYKSNGMENAGNIGDKFLLDCTDSKLKNYIMFLVAEVNREIVGAVYFIDQGGLITIWSLAVDEKYRKNGIGSELVSKGLKYFGKKRRNMISVITNLDNYASMQLFKKQGFLKEKKKVRLDKVLILDKDKF